MRWVTFSAKLLTAATLAGSLAACAGSYTAEEYDQVHSITVERAPELIELPVADEIDPRDHRRLDAFSRLYLVNGMTPLTIAYPNNVDAARAVEAMTTALVQAGVPKERLQRGAYSVETEGERGIVLSYEGPRAYSGGCSNLWGDPTRVISNRTPDRFGCSYQQNFAAMIERPSDLVEPRAPTMADAERRQAVIAAYRAGERTNSEQADVKTGTTNTQLSQ